MISIAFIYLFIGILGSELMSFTPHGGASLIFATRETQKSTNPEHEDVEKSAPVSASTSAASRFNVLSGTVGNLALTWNKVNVSIGENHILKGISGYVRRGELTALCGASGAGKTTLLAALSQTNFAGKLNGEVLVGNLPPTSSYRKTVGKQIFTAHCFLFQAFAKTTRFCSANGSSRRYCYSARGASVLGSVATAQVLFSN
jgi:ATP-binding cassette subfamily G (WHITE) protein 2 (SNQ2)